MQEAKGGAPRLGSALPGDFTAERDNTLRIGQGAGVAAPSQALHSFTEMVFGYYDRLSPPQKLVYLASDQVHAIRVHGGQALRPLVESLRETLPAGDLDRIQPIAAAIADGLTERLRVPPVDVEVLAVRPRFEEAELHGLYTRRDVARPLIQAWMRTAMHRRPVAFRTFLRTLLHELCHHLDLELLRLPLSLHTLGFYRRETSLFHQLV